MKNFSEIPDKIREHVLNSKKLAVWSMDPNPMSEPFQTGRYFQDQGWWLYPIHELEDRILGEQCFRDIRLIPDDYDILLLFCDIDRLPDVVNAIFNADYHPPLVWGHEGVIDLQSYDRLEEGGIMAVMDYDLRDYHSWLNG